MRNNFLKTFALFSLIGILLLGGSTAFAAHNVTGWLWSGYSDLDSGGTTGVGWVSLNCANRNTCASRDYGVDYNSSTGALSGYAWSSNVGWIKFDPGSPYPTGSGTRAQAAKYNSSTGKIEGWVRACSVFQTPAACSGSLSSNAGGWDGWIALSGSSAPSTYSVNFDRTVSPNLFSGYGWGGSTVMGWLSWNIAASNSNGLNLSNYGPRISLSGLCSASPSSVQPNTTVTWTATAFGGTSYTYEWSGTNIPTPAPTSNPYGIQYTTTGTKTASVKITSGGQSITQSCSTNVNVIDVDYTFTNNIQTQNPAYMLLRPGQTGTVTLIAGKTGTSGNSMNVIISMPPTVANTNGGGVPSGFNFSVSPSVLSLTSASPNKSSNLTISVPSSSAGNDYNVTVRSSDSSGVAPAKNTTFVLRVPAATCTAADNEVYASSTAAVMYYQKTLVPAGAVCSAKTLYCNNGVWRSTLYTGPTDSFTGYAAKTCSIAPSLIEI